MISRMTHLAMRAACQRAARRFHGERDHLERVQRARLQSLLGDVATARLEKPWAGEVPAWESFRETYPLTRYRDWQQAIDGQREGRWRLVDSPLVRHQPTSGSSEKLKLIPYTRRFLGELDSAIGPWLDSMYRRYPGLTGGPHYWSVSWLPQSQHQLMSGNLNDDSELMGGFKRRLAGIAQAVSPEVALAASPDDALFATLCYLVARPDLRMMSVWSPTFALQMLDALPRWGDEIVAVLRTGRWGHREASLQRLPAPRSPDRAGVLVEALRGEKRWIGQALWPSLSLVSSWHTADAAPWAEQLRQRLPQALFEGKGLWATEGVVTIPVDDHYPLAYQSHVYEFEDLASGRIYAPWELREGDEVSPIISGGNGLLRYRLDDRLVVTGFWGSVPCFRFLGRRYGVDMVGEKLSPDAARQAMLSAGKSHGLEPVTLLAVDAPTGCRPGYVAVFSEAGASGTRFVQTAGEEVERELATHFHYELARDLGQLAPVRALVAADGWKLYQQIAVAGGMIEGNIKPEPVRRVPWQAVAKVIPSAAGVFGAA